MNYDSEPGDGWKLGFLELFFFHNWQPRRKARLETSAPKAVRK